VILLAQKSQLIYIGSTDLRNLAKIQILIEAHGGVMKLLVLLSIALFTVSCGSTKSKKQSNSQVDSGEHVEFARFYIAD
jgi:hypothetical protein